MARKLSLILCAAAVVLGAAAPGAALSARHEASPLDGRWIGHATRAQLIKVGKVGVSIVNQLCGPPPAVCSPASVTFANGRFHLNSGRTNRNATGTYTVTGDVVRFVFATGVGIDPGDVAYCRWSVYRERLTFTRLPGRQCYGWNSAPWVRAG